MKMNDGKDYRNIQILGSASPKYLHGFTEAWKTGYCVALYDVVVYLKKLESNDIIRDITPKDVISMIRLNMKSLFDEKVKEDNYE